MIKTVINKILGDQNNKTIKKINPLVHKINEIEKEYFKTLKDKNDVLAKTSEFKTRIKEGESLDSILPEAFALVKLATRHLQGAKWKVSGKEITWDMIPYDVQLIGGIVMHQGNIAEMKTGEGKTLVCTLPVYLNALTGRGVFVVTVNDYLATRDAEWMEGLYNYLGLSVGIIRGGQSPEEKKSAYNCDITYGTNNEFGFDYLRDNMATSTEQIAQRELHYAIIDEVDSILIDEARTPLIISAAAEKSTDKYQQYSQLIPQLKENVHYDIDEKTKTATLTEEGIAKMEELLGVENIYTEFGFSEVHHIEQALRAQACYKADIDYIVKDDQIIIIDQFTGRLMPGRRYSQGLHQALEAKEKVEVNRESKTLATITFQNYFRLFEKLGGMTGTAVTEAEEFYTIYGLDTVVIPTNQPVMRQDLTDKIFKNQKGKYLSLAEEIKTIHNHGRPILVGTISVEQSEILSKLLQLKGIKHNVLNAKQHEREAEIIANAGQKDAVTIATNMAGRGTDIKIDDQVKKLGGLYVIGTERHESRRIDNQLRGRSGRQGDPGTSQFYVSMEDNLMRLFGGDKMKNMMNALNLPEDMPIETKLISRFIESSQKKVEGHNFDIRKHVVEYDDVMNIQREVIYKRRSQYLQKDDILEEIQTMLKEIVENTVRNYTEARPHAEWNHQEILQVINSIHSGDLKENDINKITNQSELTEKLQEYLLGAYTTREEIVGNENMRKIEKAVALRSIDTLWMEHIDAMSQLRENVAFSGLAQKQPLTEYKSQGYEMFIEMINLTRSNTINTLFKIDLERIALDQMSQRNELQNARTNAAQINRNLGLKSQENSNPVIINATPSSTNTYSTLDQETSPQNDLGKVGRNDECPCGSGKKYKKCHGISN
ncbi:preprotein translocase subunit SecA [Candidatus Peregrinibacteria bacterium HGW-Peregrinibacteria-1]|jgi:preprotein translocase subunit SecA|nr:MAG: preprotein translocase subunit SecA [Candidatus Peregrinibacteria bacterium HGW-Peregrinibacteria-1]